MTGRLYPGGPKARRERRRADQRRDNWRSIRDAAAVVGTGVGLAGLGVLAFADFSQVYLAIALVTSAGLLMLFAAYAALRAVRAAHPEPLMPSPGDGAETIDLAEAIARESARNPRFQAGVAAAARRMAGRQR